MIDSPVAKITQRFPGVRSMFSHLGVSVPDRDGLKFKSPFREDLKPSCTIHNDRFYDWSLGEKPLDAIGVFAMAKGLTNSEAIKELAPLDVPIPPVRPVELKAIRPARPPFRELETPTAEDIDYLARNRRIFSYSLTFARNTGHLFCGDTNEGRAWIVTDTSRRVCQSRLLSGDPWRLLNAKAWTSVKQQGFAGWPLGACDIGDRQRVILCEGGPDWLVAHEAEPEIAVCTMLGAKQAIHADALPLFYGKTVRILAHGDPSGDEACKRWATQLFKAGATVSAVRIDFGGAKDLNDCATLPADQLAKFHISALLS